MKIGTNLDVDPNLQDTHQQEIVIQAALPSLLHGSLRNRTRHPMYPLLFDIGQRPSPTNQQAPNHPKHQSLFPPLTMPPLPSTAGYQGESLPFPYEQTM